MEIHQIKIDDLKPAEYNPRKWSEEQIKQLKSSIGKFGLVEPIVANRAQGRENVVIGGHFRLYVAKQLGFVDVPVVYVNIPDLEKEKELNLRLNRNVGEFDFKMLGEFDEDLLKEVGFTGFEIDKAFDLKTSEDEFDADEEAKKIENPQAQLGDVYELCEHRLMCGDSTKPEDVKKLMGGGLAQLIFTDPPYMVDYKSPVGLSYNSKKYAGSDGKIFNDNLSDEKAMEFYIAVLKNLYENSTDTCPIYWWFASKNMLMNRIAFAETDWYFSQMIIWLKNSMILSRGQDYHRCYEPCLFGWKKGKTHFSNKQIADLKDSWMELDFESFQDQLEVWFQKRDTTTEYVHPTQKPVGLAERALRKSSRQGDIVLDLFGGSGSTLIACQQMMRRAFVMELDPRYVDVIIARWQKLTGLEAKKL